MTLTCNIHSVTLKCDSFFGFGFLIWILIYVPREIVYIYIYISVPLSFVLLVRRFHEPNSAVRNHWIGGMFFRGFLVVDLKYTHKNLRQSCTNFGINLLSYPTNLLSLLINKLSLSLS